MNGRRGNAFDVDYPLCSYGHICWLLNLKKMLRCEWGWNSLWQEHALAGDHPCKLFFSQPTPVTSENKHISKKWAKSCWNNAGDHYNVFFPHPKPTSTSAEKERLTLQYALLPANIFGYIWKGMYLGPRPHTIDICIICTISCVWNVIDVCEIVVFFASVEKNVWNIWSMLEIDRK